MAYIIETLSGEFVSSGQTRQQIARVVATLVPEYKLPTLPRHGRALMIVQALPMPSYRITAV